MAKNDSETPGQGPDSKEAVASAVRNDSSLLDSAVRAFIESRYRAEGFALYQDFIKYPLSGRGRLTKAFESFAAKGPYKSLCNPEISKKLRETEIFDAEIAKVGITLENRKKSLETAIENEFDFSEEVDRGKIKDEIAHLEIRNLDRFLKSQGDREKFLASLFGKAVVATKRRSFVAYVEKLKLGELDETQKKRLLKFRESFVGMGVNASDVKDFLSCLGNTPYDIEAKRKFIQAFLPNVSLGMLVKESILTEREAREALVTRVTGSPEYHGFFEGLNAEKKAVSRNVVSDAIERLDLDDILIPSSQLNEGSLDKILKTEELSISIAEELERGFRELKEVVAGEFEIEEDADTGKFVPAYVAELRENLKNAEGEETIEYFQILEDFLLKGGVPPIVHLNEGYDPMNGQPKMDVQFRIVGIGDSKNPAERRVKLENLTPKGENVSAEPYSLSYADFYKLLSSLKGARVFSKEDWANELRKGERYLRDSVTGEVLTHDENGKEFIASLDELNAKLDELTDPEGVGRTIAVGRSFMIGKPGEAHFNVGTVVGVDVASKKITVRNTLGTEQSFSYAEFFQIFIETGGKRLEPSASSIGGVLKLQAGGKR
jgi:hypothetical protein